MGKDSESKKQNDTEARENSSPTTGRPVLKGKRLELKPLEKDHPLWTSGWIVGVKLLNPSSKKPLDEAEIEE